MSISNEFKDAVLDNNVIRIRIMLKDSLLVDRTFKLFEEQILYAEGKGIQVWMESDEPMEVTDEAWSVDDLNLELTILVNDFTRERVDVIKRMIKKIYPPQKQRNKAKSKSSNAQHYPKDVDNKQHYKRMVQCSKEIFLIINPRERKYHAWTSDRDWLIKDIESIRDYAEDIVDTCNIIIKNMEEQRL